MRNTISRAGMLAIAAAVALNGCTDSGTPEVRGTTPAETPAPADDEFEVALADWWAEDAPADQLLVCAYIDEVGMDAAIDEMAHGWAEDRPDGPEWNAEIAAVWVEAHCESLRAEFDADEQQEAPADILAYGETFSWPSGVEITVNQPWVERNLEADESYDEHSTVMVYFPLAIANYGGEAYDATLMFTKVFSGGYEGTWVAEADVPTMTLLPEQTAEVTISYAVADPTDVTMSVTPEGQVWDASNWTGGIE